MDENLRNAEKAYKENGNAEPYLRTLQRGGKDFMSAWVFDKGSWHKAVFDENHPYFWKDDTCIYAVLCRAHDEEMNNCNGTSLL